VTDPDRPSRYRYLSFNAPLGEARADAIAARLAAAGPADVLDVGCGWAELLLRVLQRQPAATGLGVDTDDDLLDRGRQAARERGLAGRVRLESLAADRVTEPADLVIAVGSSHAFGTNAQALAALWPLVRPGGRLLFGDGLWDPRAATGDLALVWDDLPELPELDGLVDLAVAAATNSTRSSPGSSPTRRSGCSPTRATRSPRRSGSGPTSIGGAGCRATAAPSASHT
jgi:SAM-dependent methyltransferase